MKITPLLILVAATMAKSLALRAQPLQPEVLYNFPLGPRYPECRLVEGHDGSFYGTTRGGGSHDEGTFFRLSTDDILTTLLWFDGTNGAAPTGPLALDEDGNIYGTTTGGGAYGKGTVFRVTPNGALTTLVSFNGPDCCSDPGELILGRDGNLYGTTFEGGTNNLGAVFRVTPSGLLTTLASFTGSNGAYPNGLVMGNDGNFYGTTYARGSMYVDPNRLGQGTVFKLTKEGELTTLVSFNGTNGTYPNGLLLGNDGNLYGATDLGGSNWLSNDSFGTVFRVTTNGGFTVLLSFDGTNGAAPRGPLALGEDGNIYGTTRYGGSNNAGTMFKLSADGTLTALGSFTYPNRPEDAEWNAMVLGGDGNFYGTTYEGGNSQLGSVFKLTTNGDLSTLVSLSETSAADMSALVLGNDGNFYGTTPRGGSSGFGTAFELTTNGLFNTLVSFNGTNGIGPSGLVSGGDRNFYGTTVHGGSSDFGTAFELTTNGVFSTLVSFNGTNGIGPGGLVSGGDGNFYGTTHDGGSNHFGTAFKVSANGVLTTLLSFATDRGAFLLAVGNEGTLYGATGAPSPYGLFSSTNGSVFKLTADEKLTTLVSFSSGGNSWLNSLVLGSDGSLYGIAPNWGVRCGYGCNYPLGFGSIVKITTQVEVIPLALFTGSNGASPSGLVMGNDGNLYGTTSRGGNGSLVTTNNFGFIGVLGLGTVYKLTTSGVLTTLVSFDGTNGSGPTQGLLPGSDGSFYGAAGIVFRITPEGVLTTLASLVSSAENLVWGGDGNLYGTTPSGGSGGGGTFFRLVLPSFRGVARQPGRSMLVSGTGPANGAFRLWTSPEVSMPFASWTLLTSSSFDRTGNFSFTDASAPTNKSRFYQLSVP